MQLNEWIWKPSDTPVNIESNIHPHIVEEKAHLFSSADGGSTEYEVLNWLHSTIRVLKPNLILETGGYQGIGTVALAHACKLNGFGKVISLEYLPSQCVAIENLLQENNLQKYVDVINMDSLRYLRNTSEIFDIGFFDSETTIRAHECDILLSKNALRNLAVFHDTSPYRIESYTSKEIQEKYRNDVIHLSKHPRCSGYYDSKLSRGFMTLWFNSL